MKRTHWFLLIIIALLVVVFWKPDTGFLNKPYSAVVTDTTGDLLSAQIATDGQWRLPILDAIPDRFAKAIVTFEDKRYYNHIGIDPLAVVRSARINYNAGRVVSGASTIPMQLARLSRDRPPRNWSSKLREALMAIRLSIWYDKATILNWYASMAPFGGNVIGLTAASWRYYGKDPKSLTWAEAATLAVLPNAPSLIHVNKNRNRLLEKRNSLLTRLQENGTIDELDLEAALSEPLPKKVYALPSKAPHYLQYRKVYSSDNIATLSGEKQEIVNRIIRELNIEWQGNEIYNAGAVILDMKTGKPLVYVGNVPGAVEEGDVDMVQALRSSGSILKPFLYASLIDDGIITPKQLLLDVPIYISGFSPSNYNRQFSGVVGADEALQRSLNVPAVLMLQQYGIGKFLKLLNEFGLTTLTKDADHYGLSLILGGGEVSLWELAHAYRELGLICQQKASRRISAGAAFHTLEALTKLHRPDEEGNWQRFSTSAKIAWKTGTSYGHRDAWAIGVTPEVVIATWVGNADGEGRDGIVGTSTAGRLLFRIVNQLDLGNSWFDPPYEDLEWTSVCSRSGMLASVHCPVIDTTLMTKHAVVADVCSFHRKIFLDSDGAYSLNNTCSEGHGGRWDTYFQLDAIAANYYKQSHPSFRSIPPLHPSCLNDVQDERSMTFVYPAYNDKILLPIDLNLQEQEMVLEVAHQQALATLHWYMDQRYLGSTTEWHKYAIRPMPGIHKVTVFDQTGSELSNVFEILAR